MNKKDKRIDLGNGLVEIIEYYYNDKVNYHYFTLNDKWHGEFRDYYLNNNLCVHHHYKNHEFEGE